MSWLPKRCVVVPVDFSEQTFAAVKLALDLVEETSGVHVIHVLPPMSAMDPGMIWDAVDDEQRCRHAEQALETRLSDPQFDHVETHVAVGDPGQEIIEFAEEQRGHVLYRVPAANKEAPRRNSQAQR